MIPETKVANQIIEEVVITANEAELVEPMIEKEAEPLNPIQEVEIIETLETSAIEELQASEVITAQKQQILSLDEIVAEPQLISDISNSLFTEKGTLLAINSNSYTVQVSGMSNEKSLKDFIKEHNLPQKNVYLYKTLRNKKTWYVVIYGQFENRQSANEANQNLPASFSKLSGWVKQYASVHQDLQLNEQ